MSFLARLLRRPRLVDEGALALSVALVGAAAGVLIAALSLPPRMQPFPTAPTGTQWFLVLAKGFAGGWWGGLAWSVALALAARRMTPPPAVGLLFPAALHAAAVTVAFAAAGRALAAPPRYTLPAGLVIATLAAVLRLNRAATAGPG